MGLGNYDRCAPLQWHTPGAVPPETAALQCNGTQCHDVTSSFSQLLPHKSDGACGHLQQVPDSGRDWSLDVLIVVGWYSVQVVPRAHVLVCHAPLNLCANKFMSFDPTTDWMKGSTVVKEGCSANAMAMVLENTEENPDLILAHKRRIGSLQEQNGSRYCVYSATELYLDCQQVS